MAGTRRPTRTPAKGRAGRATQPDYLQKILTARVYDVAIETLARARAAPVRAPGQHGAAQARGPAAGVQLQAARRLQQDGAPERRRSCRRGVICASAGNHAQGVALSAQTLGCTAVIVMPVTTPAAEDRRRARARRRGRAARRQLLRCLRARARARARTRPDLRAPVRRPRRDRRPGHDRDGDPAPAPGPDRRGVRRHRRRRADLRRRGLHQGGATGDQGHRRADDRLRRDDALGTRRQARPARRGRACSPTARRSSSSATRPSA